MTGKIIKFWERFEILYCRLGLEKKDCFEILQSERYAVGSWRQFAGRVSKRIGQEAEWRERHAAASVLRSYLERPHEAALAMAMEVLQRFHMQLAEKKILTPEDVSNVILFAGRALELSQKHPKYHTRQTVGVLRAEASAIPWNPAVQIVYEAMRRVPEFEALLQNPTLNRRFIGELESTTKRVLEGEIRIESAPKAVRGEVAP